MPEMPSSVFRVAYLTLTEPTVVTSNGRPIGRWVPSAFDHPQQQGRPGLEAVLYPQTVDTPSGQVDPETGEIVVPALPPAANPKGGYSPPAKRPAPVDLTRKA